MHVDAQRGHIVTVNKFEIEYETPHPLETQVRCAPYWEANHP